VNSAKGVLEPPVHGGFKGNRGEFHGEDTDAGRPILCRFIWAVDCESPRWEQAFSTDQGAGWQTNWIMDFTRSSAWHMASAPDSWHG
jgi:hypothetical protein